MPTRLQAVTLRTVIIDKKVGKHASITRQRKDNILGEVGIPRAHGSVTEVVRVELRPQTLGEAMVRYQGRAEPDTLVVLDRVVLNVAETEGMCGVAVLVVDHLWVRALEQDVGCRYGIVESVCRGRYVLRLVV